MSTETSTKDLARPTSSVALGVSHTENEVSGWMRRHVHLLVLLIPVVLVSLPFWPGHMNADTLNEISEVISGNLTDYHGPILLAIWHLFWGAGFGPGWVLVAQVCCFVSGAYLLMRLAFGPFGAAIAASVLTLLPQSYGGLALVGRDAWYCALLLLSTGALAWGFGWSGRRSSVHRVATIVLSLTAGWLALAARQNAVTSVVVIFGAAIALTLATRWQRPAVSVAGRLKRLAIVVIGAAVLTLAMYESQVVVEDVIGVQHVHPEQYIYDFDLAGMSIREHRDLFPQSILPRNRLANLVPFFSLDDISPEVAAPGAPLPHHMLDARQVAAERAAEIKAVKHAPFTWFDLHWDEFLRQLSITRAANVIIHPGIDENPFGLHAKFPGLDRRARGYVEAFDQTSVPEAQGGVLFAVWIYIAIALLGLVALRWWRQPRGLLVGALALSSVTYQIGAFLSMGVQYRLEFPSVVTGLVVLIVGGRILRDTLPRRSGSAVSAISTPEG